MIDINDMNACNDINHNSDSDWRWAIMDSEAACSTQHRDDTLSDTAKAIAALVVHSRSFNQATLEDIPDTVLDTGSLIVPKPWWLMAITTTSMTVLNCQCH